MNKICKIITALLAVAVIFTTADCMSIAQADALPESASGDASSIINKVEKTVPADVVSIQLPTTSEDNESDSVLDFIMDPQRLITETDAARYDGADFERNATVFFRNSNGALTSHSDDLTIWSQSTVPVRVTVTARMQNTGSITMSTDPSFTGDTSPSLYMALVDDSGNEIPLDDTGSATLVAELPPVSLSSDDTNDGSNSSSSYCFSLKGTCNADADWTEVQDASPQVVLTWTAEPVINHEKRNVEPVKSTDSQNTDNTNIETDIEKTEEPIENVEGKREDTTDTEKSDSSAR